MAMELSSMPPTAAEFAELRAACGWGAIDPAIASRALAAGLLSAVVRDGARLAGFGRVVGDGVLYFYLQDIIVRPEYRGQGVGRLIVEALLADVLERAPIAPPLG